MRNKSSDMAKINGENFVIAEPITVSDFLISRGINKDTVAVELNGEILSRTSFENSYINAEDEVEIVNFVCGG
ncbi:MAG: sulfur carrier protein ThiS [Deferribacteraceae bacterium]|jgi:sulfur carrier protein|nr:sulfur carrier protein ThiS [Deferribacteraceae bacterium]